MYLLRELSTIILPVVTLMLGKAQDGTGALCLLMLTYVFIKRALNNNIASCEAWSGGMQAKGILKQNPEANIWMSMGSGEVSTMRYFIVCPVHVI